MTAKYIEILFRMYGVFNLIVGLMAIAIAATAFRRGDAWAWWTLLVANTMALVSAMTYDATVNAIGPFELSEYLGLLLVYIALALTARLRTAGRAIAATGLQGPSCERCESASMPVSVSPECLHAGRRIEGTQVDGGERSGGT